MLAYILLATFGLLLLCPWVDSLFLAYPEVRAQSLPFTLHSLPGMSNLPHGSEKQAGPLRPTAQTFHMMEFISSHFCCAYLLLHKHINSTCSEWPISPRNLLIYSMMSLVIELVTPGCFLSPRHAPVVKTLVLVSIRSHALLSVLADSLISLFAVVDS